MGWTLLLTYPLMVVIQSMSARIGRVSGRGLAGNLRQHYPNWVLQWIVALLFLANTLNIGADLTAMAEAARLVWHGPSAWALVLAQTAEALRPLAGEFAFALFALGIIGTGLLSVPVLAGSAAYALGESRRWPVGLTRRPLEAKAFYTAILVATFLGAILTLTSMNAVTALVWVAVINAIVAVPVMGLMTLMTRNAKIMGPFVVSGVWSIKGWLTTALMAGAAAVFAWSMLAQRVAPA